MEFSNEKMIISLYWLYLIGFFVLTIIIILVSIVLKKIKGYDEYEIIPKLT